MAQDSSETHFKSPRFDSLVKTDEPDSIEPASRRLSEKSILEDPIDPSCLPLAVKHVIVSSLDKPQVQEWVNIFENQGLLRICN